MDFRSEGSASPARSGRRADALSYLAFSVPSTPRSSRTVAITPLPSLKGVRTIALFGGSFDPPHHYHTHVVPLAVARVCGPASLTLFVPAAASPFKPRGPVASNRDRLDLLAASLPEGASARAAGGESSRVAIWTDELDRDAARPVAPSFTIDTLRRLREVVPDRITLCFVVGADQLAGFHRWKLPRRILDLAEPILLPRAPILTPDDVWNALDHTFWTRSQRLEWCGRLAPVPPEPDASTSLRAALAGVAANVKSWKSHPVLGRLAPRAAAIIRARGLYGASASPRDGH